MLGITLLFGFDRLDAKMCEVATWEIVPLISHEGVEGNN